MFVRSLTALVLVMFIATVAVAEPPRHAGVLTSQKLIADISTAKYAKTVYRFTSDGELDEPARARAFRALERYIAGHKWNVRAATVTYARGVEDAVDVWLDGGDNAWLALYVGYHYDTKQWRVDGYEYPGQTFAREGKSIEEYVKQALEQIRALPLVGAHRPKQDGEFRLMP